MEFTGRIQKVLQGKSGISQRTGKEWKSLPFIFEYFENPSDWYSNSVLLETFDENIIASVVENATVRINFTHRTREHEGRYFNDIRIKSFILMGQQSAPVAGPHAASDTIETIPAPEVPQPQEGGEENDDLPF